MTRLLLKINHSQWFYYSNSHWSKWIKYLKIGPITCHVIPLCVWIFPHNGKGGYSTTGLTKYDLEKTLAILSQMLSFLSRSPARIIPWNLAWQDQHVNWIPTDSFVWFVFCISFYTSPLYGNEGFKDVDNKR